MDLPNLRHFENRGIFFVSSDPVEALAGEAWVPAVYTDKGWATADGASLLTGIQEWRNVVEETSNLGEHSPRNQGGQISKASTSNRIRKSRKKPEAES